MLFPIPIIIRRRIFTAVLLRLLKDMKLWKMQFFWLYNEDEEKSRLFIFDEIEDGSCFAPDNIQKLALSGEIKQELAWDNGRLKVVSGYE